MAKVHPGVYIKDEIQSTKHVNETVNNASNQMATGNVNIRKMLSTNEDSNVAEAQKKASRRKSLTNSLTPTAMLRSNAEFSFAEEKTDGNDGDPLVLQLLNQVSVSLSELQQGDKAAWQSLTDLTSNIVRNASDAESLVTKVKLVSLLREFKYNPEIGWPAAGEQVDVGRLYNRLCTLYLEAKTDDDDEAKNAIKVKNMESLSFCPNLLFSNFPHEFLSKPCVSVFDGAVLLADISGFSKFAGEMCGRGVKGLDVLHKVTSGFLGHFVKTVYEYDGDVIAFAGDALVCVFPSGTVTASNGVQSTRSLDDACAQALRCAYILRTYNMHTLSAHFAVSCGPIQFALLGGVNDEWTHLMNGPCISELTACIDSAPPQSVACTLVCLESAQRVQPLIMASRAENSNCYLITDFHHISKHPLSDSSTQRGTSTSTESDISQRIANLSSKTGANQQGQLLVTVPSETTPAPLSSIGTPNSNASSGFLDRQFSGKISRTLSGEGALATTTPVSVTTNAKTTSNDSQDSSQSIALMVKKASYFVPKPVMSFLNVGSLKGISELRTITTMFINLDSYSLKDNVDPLSLQPFLVLVQEILSKSGGFLRQFLIDDKGCVAIAMWGVPNYNHTNNSYRGLYSAWNLHARVAELNHRVSIGLTQGQAYCGTVGSTLRRDYAGIGDKVNMAARLMAKAKGRVLVDPDVFALLDSTEKRYLVPFQELQLKGMKQPMTPYMFCEDADMTEFRDQDAEHHSNTIIRQDVMKRILGVLDQSVQGTPFLSRLRLDAGGGGRNSDLKSAILIDTSGDHDETQTKREPLDGTANSSDRQTDGVASSARRGTIRGSVTRLGSMLGLATEDPPDVQPVNQGAGSRKRSVLIVSGNTAESGAAAGGAGQNLSEKRSERRRSVIRLESNNTEEESPKAQITPKGFLGGTKFSSSKYILGTGRTASNAAMMNSTKQQNGLNGDSNPFIVLHGVSGTGKTTAAQFFKMSAVRRKLRFVCVHCRQEDELVPFAIIRKLFWEIAGRNKHNNNQLKKHLIDDLLAQTRSEEGVKYIATDESSLVFQEMLMDKEKRGDDDILQPSNAGDDNLDRKFEQSSRTRVANMTLHAIADYEDEEYDGSVDVVNLATSRRASRDVDDSNTAEDKEFKRTTSGQGQPGSSHKSQKAIGDNSVAKVSALARADPEETNYLFVMMLEALLSNFPSATAVVLEDAQYIDEQSLELLQRVQLHKMKIVVLMTVLQQVSAVMPGLADVDSPARSSTETARTGDGGGQDDFRAIGSAAVELHVASKTLQMAGRLSAKTSMGSNRTKAGQGIFQNQSYLAIAASPSTIAVEMRPLISAEIAIVLKQLFNAKITATPVLADPKRRRSFGSIGAAVTRIEEKSEGDQSGSGAANTGDGSTNSNANSRRNSDNSGQTNNSNGGAADAIPDDLVQKVLEMTAGNAVWVKVIGRFIREFGVRNFIETTEKGSSSDCLKNIIICRLEKLDLEQQIVLKHASVLGLQFSVRSLAAVVPEVALPNLLNTIGVLCELGFVVCIEETPLAIYAFQHKLSRDTIYGLLPHSDATEIHIAACNYLEAKYADALHPFYQSLGYHYSCARGHHELAFKFTVKAADHLLRRKAYDAGLENLRVAARICRSASETAIVLEVLNRMVREFARRTEQKSRLRRSSHANGSMSLATASTPALVLGLSSNKKASSPGGTEGAAAAAEVEDADVVLLRKFRELKTFVDNQLLAAESALASQRLQSMTNENDSAAPARGMLGKKQISFVSGFGEADSSAINAPGPLKWQLSFGDVSRVQRVSSVSNLAPSNSVSGFGGMGMGLFGSRSNKGSSSSKSTKDEKQQQQQRLGADNNILNNEGSPMRNSSQAELLTFCLPHVSCVIS